MARCRRALPATTPSRLRNEDGIAAKDELVLLLKSCASSSPSPHSGMLLHAYILLESAIPLDVFLENTLLSMYSKHGCLEDAAIVFRQMQAKNTVSWTVMITCYAKHGHHKDALDLYKFMDLDVKLNVVTVVCLIHSCTSLAEVECANFIHSDVYKHAFEHDVVVGSSLLNMYAKHGYLDEARKVFHDLLHKNVVTWTSMIVAYSDHGFVDQAFELFEKMQNEGVKPDIVTFQSVLKACISIESLHIGKHYHVIFLGAELVHSVSLENALINMYAKCGRLDISRKIFAKMKRRDVASWSMVIAGFVECGLIKVAVEYFKKMQIEMVKPNDVTYISILKACANMKCLKDGQIIHNTVVEDEFWGENFVASALIDMYCRCDQITDAFHVFNSSAIKDVVLWTAMIGGCVQQGCNEEALELFDEMQINGVKPNEITFVTLLSACSSLIHLERGAQIHQEICKNGLNSSMEIGTSLILMYSNYGQLEEARCVLERLPSWSLIAYTAMVVAYAQHGYGKEALELVHKMHRREMKLDHISFIGILTACNNAGLVNEAVELFELMQEYYNLSPSTKHYTCMVDAFGRAGQIEQADNLVTKMPLQPNFISRRALLSACKNHEKMDLSDHVAKQVLYFEPQEAEDFVLLANIYSANADKDDINSKLVSHTSSGQVT